MGMAEHLAGLKRKGQLTGKKGKASAKVGKVVKEFHAGKLHSGSKTGPKVTNLSQAIAIGYSEAKRAATAKK
jgi:hypothetical protein